MGLKRARGLIVAIEEKQEDLINVVSKFEDVIFKVKTNSFYNGTMDILKTKDNSIIYDAKLAEVKDYISREINRGKEYEVDGIITHGFMGKENISKCVEIAGNMDVIILADVTDRNSYYDFHYKEIANDAKKVGAKGVVVPANKALRIKEVRNIIGNEMYILTTGVGIQGGNLKSVLESGADYVIVGRNIIRSKKPEEKIKYYLDTLNSYS